MKNFKRISSLIVALVMIVATMSAMFVTASAADVAAGTAWSPSNIDTGVMEDGPFKIYGLNNATNEKLVPSSESVVEWGTWRHKVTIGETQYIAYMQPEKPEATPDFKFGFNPSKAEASSLLVFTAPESGTYSLEAIFVKLFGTNGGVKSVANISVYKNGTGDALVSVINQDYTQQVTDEEVDASVASVELAKNDELWIVVRRDATSESNGGYNVQVKSLKVTLVSVSSAPSTPSNPTTGDALVVSFAVAVVAGVAIVASKKRR